MYVIPTKHVLCNFFTFHITKVWSVGFERGLVRWVGESEKEALFSEDRGGGELFSEGGRGRAGGISEQRDL